MNNTDKTERKVNFGKLIQRNVDGSPNMKLTLAYVQSGIESWLKNNEIDPNDIRVAVVQAYENIVKTTGDELVKIDDLIYHTTNALPNSNSISNIKNAQAQIRLFIRNSTDLFTIAAGPRGSVSRSTASTAENA